MRAALLLLAATLAAAACESRLRFSDEIAGPERISATAARSRVLLAWSPVDGAAAYTVYQGREPDVSPSLHARALASTGAQLAIEQVIPGTVYHFVVTAHVGGVETEPSAAVSAAALEDTPVSTGQDWFVRGSLGEEFGASLAARDLDRDGRADLAVGSASLVVGTALVGGVTVFAGTPGEGLGSQAAFQAPGKQDRGGFGTVLAAVPDVGNDGYDDLLVPEPRGFFDESGRVYAYHGRSGGELEGGIIGCYPPGFEECPYIFASDFRANAGAALGAFDDLDGDAHPDLLVGSPFLAAGATSGGLLELFRASTVAGVSHPPAWTWRSAEPLDGLGSAIAAGEDVDGDGVEDALVGAPNGAAGAGRVYLFLGSAGVLGSGAAWTLDGGADGDGLGRHVLLARLDCDPRAEVVVAEPGWDAPGAQDAGRVRVFRGGPPPLTLWAEVTGVQAGESLGVLAAAGDVDGDGCGDLFVGSPGFDGIFDDEGRAQVLGGSVTGLGADPIWTDAGRAPGARFGAALAEGADMDGDGFLDLAVGAPGYEAGTGLAALYRGLAPTGPHPSAGLPARAPAGVPFTPVLAGFSDPTAGQAFVCRWTWGDGTEETEVSPCTPSSAGEVTHVFAEPGRYRVKLRVERLGDAGGAGPTAGEAVTTVVAE